MLLQDKLRHLNNGNTPPLPPHAHAADLDKGQTVLYEASGSWFVKDLSDFSHWYQTYIMLVLQLRSQCFREPQQFPNVVHFSLSRRSCLYIGRSRETCPQHPFLLVLNHFSDPSLTLSLILLGKSALLLCFAADSIFSVHSNVQFRLLLIFFSVLTCTKWTHFPS